MPSTTSNKSQLLRLPQIIGQPEVTEEQAADNRRTGKGPKRPRKGFPALIPVSASTWWAGVKAGRFPAPVRLAGNITAWRAEDIHRLIDEGVDQ